MDGGNEHGPAASRRTVVEYHKLNLHPRSFYALDLGRSGDRLADDGARRERRRLVFRPVLLLFFTSFLPLLFTRRETRLPVSAFCTAWALPAIAPNVDPIEPAILIKSASSFVCLAVSAFICPFQSRRKVRRETHPERVK